MSEYIDNKTCLAAAAMLLIVAVILVVVGIVIGSKLL